MHVNGLASPSHCACYRVGLSHNALFWKTQKHSVNGASRQTASLEASHSATPRERRDSVNIAKTSGAVITCQQICSSPYDPLKDMCIDCVYLLLYNLVIGKEIS